MRPSWIHANTGCSKVLPTVINYRIFKGNRLANDTNALSLQILERSHQTLGLCTLPTIQRRERTSDRTNEGKNMHMVYYRLSYEHFRKSRRSHHHHHHTSQSPNTHKHFKYSVYIAAPRECAYPLHMYIYSYAVAMASAVCWHTLVACMLFQTTF